MNSIDSTAINKTGWRSRIFSAVSWLLVHPWLGLFLALLAVLLSLPALWIGLQMDDYLHRMIMLDLTPFKVHSSKIFSAYNFMESNAERFRVAVERGIMPWWAAPDGRFSLFRPLGSMSLWLDYQLWPDLPAMMHLHSILWYAAVVGAVTVFYRRIMGATWIAGLAALLFAVDSRHSLPVAWIANRHALISLFFGVLCLIAYDGWRRSRKKWLALASPACLVLSLLAGETGLAAAGFLFAYMIALDNGKLKQRLLALLPGAAVVLVYLVIYKVFDYGASGSGMYLDPLSEPAAFFKAFVIRVPLLLVSQWTPVPAQIKAMVSMQAVIAIVSVVFIVLVFLLYRMVRHDRVARFWTIGMLLSLVPIAGAEPAERLLLFVGLGAMGLLAQLLGGLVDRSASLPSHRAWRLAAVPLGIILALAHLVVSPLAFPGNPKYLKLMNDFYMNPVRSIPDERELSSQSLILVNPPDYAFSAGWMPFFRIVDGKRYPRRVRSLSGGPGPVEIFRVDDRTLRVRTPKGLFKYFLGNLFLSTEKQPVAGQEYDLGDVLIHINSVGGEYGPTEVTYRFSVPLEDAALRWMQLDKDRYVPFAPPAVGSSVVLHGANLMDVFFSKKGKKS